MTLDGFKLRQEDAISVWSEYVLKAAYGNSKSKQTFASKFVCKLGTCFVAFLFAELLLENF